MRKPDAAVFRERHQPSRTEAHRSGRFRFCRRLPQLPSAGSADQVPSDVPQVRRAAGLGVEHGPGTSRLTPDELVGEEQLAPTREAATKIGLDQLFGERLGALLGQTQRVTRQRQQGNDDEWHVVGGAGG